MTQISTPTMGLGTTRLGTATGMLLIISHSSIPVLMGKPLRRFPQAPSLGLRAHLLTTCKQAVVALRARALSEGNFAHCDGRQGIQRASFPARRHRCCLFASSGVFVMTQTATGSLWE